MGKFRGQDIFSDKEKIIQFLDFFLLPASLTSIVQLKKKPVSAYLNFNAKIKSDPADHRGFAT